MMHSMRFFLASVLVLAACGGKTALREPDEYTGCGTDENWIAFDDQEPHATIGDAMAPQITAPAANATVAFAQKPTITWAQDPNDPGMTTGDVIHTGPGCTDCCPQWNGGALSVMHLPPISGNAYDLQFSVGGNVVWRVVTTLQEWAPTDATWASWKGKKVSLQIWRMNLLRNDVTPTGGPFTSSQPFVFTVGS
jgi:hypothetical protein